MKIDKLEFVRKTITEIKGEDVSFTEDTLLADLGLDSLDIVEIQMAYEDASGTEVPDTDRRIQTIADLLKFMV